jgi:hypothetical protein
MTGTPKFNGSKAKRLNRRFIRSPHLNQSESGRAFMSSCEKEVKSTGASKMAKISGSAKNFEHTGDRAERLCRGGYADGGEVTWDKGSGRGMLEDRKYAGMRQQTGNYTGPKE